MTEKQRAKELIDNNYVILRDETDLSPKFCLELAKKLALHQANDHLSSLFDIAGDRIPIDKHKYNHKFYIEVIKEIANNED